VACILPMGKTHRQSWTRSVRVWTGSLMTVPPKLSIYRGRLRRWLVS
jgi:hypothetical protein